MGLNPDASRQLEVTFGTPREGSCLSLELLQELASLIRIQLPAAGKGDVICLAADQNNIASLNAENCLLVPAAKIYTEEQTWDAGAAEDVVFEAFQAEGIDATACFFGCVLLLDSAEAGKTADGENIRPNFEVVELSRDKIIIAVKNASSDVVVRIQLLQVPIPAEQP